ncbi:hypothetical protein [Gemmobacter denitrificans]|uniref:Permuted papain-like amidase YaeF/Yiix C92 family enzyme n=1 Tax=Gemmobacter denitrificans TaxID=3123040 RepID=A0ABU8C1K7_9RHOB
MTGTNKNLATAKAEGVKLITVEDQLFLQAADLQPGDVLLYRPQKPNMVQMKISAATSSPYTHAAIYLGDGKIADSNIPFGVSIRDFPASLHGSRCIAVLRSQCGFGEYHRQKLAAFVAAVNANAKFYDLISVLKFKTESTAYFENQLEFIRENFGRHTLSEEYARQSFFCSAFIVACYSVVGIIHETAQVAYQPDFFSPGHLCKDPTFGWLLGYLVPDGGSVPHDDPALLNATLWRDCPDLRWW